MIVNLNFEFYSHLCMFLLDVFDRTKKIDEMSVFVEEKSKSVVNNRKNFENNISLCQQWFCEVEVIMSADIRLSNINIVEDQLQKVNELLFTT